MAKLALNKFKNTVIVSVFMSLIFDFSEYSSKRRVTSNLEMKGTLKNLDIIREKSQKEENRQKIN